MLSPIRRSFKFAALAIMVAVGLPHEAYSVPSGQTTNASSQAAQTAARPAQSIPAPGTGSCSFLAPCEDSYVSCLSRYMPNERQRQLLAEIRRIKAEIAALASASAGASQSTQDGNLRRAAELQVQLEALVREAERLARLSGPLPQYCRPLWDACCRSGQ